MTTLVEFIIIASADNRPPMLEKSLYDSWKIRMENYMDNRENGIMILSSVQNGPLIWPTITKADGTTRTKTYEELSATEKFKLITIAKLLISFFKISYHSPQASTQPMNEFPQMDSGLAVNVFNLGDDRIACLNKAMAFLTVVTSLSYKGNATNSGGNNTGGQVRVVKCYNYQGEGRMARQCTQPNRPRNAAWFKEKAMLAEVQEAGKILDEEQLAFLVDPGIPDGQAAQITILNTAAF
nr:hypothetical protein [Tanacetum cinerariifolium]